MISCGCYDPDTNCEKTASLRNHSRANPLSPKLYIPSTISTEMEIKMNWFLVVDLLVHQVILKSYGL